MGALLYNQHYSQDEEWEQYRNEHISNIIDKAKLWFDKDCSEDEILYGNAGYVYWLLRLLKEIEFKSTEAVKLQEKIMSILDDVVLQLYNTGLKIGEDEDTLLFRFPRRDGKYYLGGAHGTIGILYMLLLASEVTPTLSENAEIMETIEHSCKFIVKLQLKSGNFPSSFGKSEDKLLHFCHGAPGAIPFLIKAYEIFDDEIYLKSAEKAGNLVWERGILLKGNWLWHGISGNSYALHSLYRATKDPKWKYRAMKLAYSTCDEEIQQKVENYDDKGRLETGIPDTPYSLMEGMAGNTVMLIEFICQEKYDPKFPGYEI